MFIRHRGRVYFGLVRKQDEGHIESLPQTPAGSELAASSPAKALGGSRFLIPWCKNTDINVWKMNSAFFLPLL